LETVEKAEARNPRIEMISAVHPARNEKKFSTGRKYKGGTGCRDARDARAMKFARELVRSHSHALLISRHGRVSFLNETRREKKSTEKPNGMKYVSSERRLSSFSNRQRSRSAFVLALKGTFADFARANTGDGCRGLN